jgi:lipid-binding SYLF domain-containing protein
MSLRSAHREIAALTARRASHQLWSHAGLIVERYSLRSASVDRSKASLVGAILNALHYSCLIGMGLVLLAQTADARELSLQALDERLSSCSTVIRNVLEMSDQSIPKSLLRRCRGLAIFPGVVALSAVVGLSYGRGVILRRDERTDEWSKPAFFTIGGGSIGAQIGAQSVDLILLVMSEEGVQALLEDKFTLGADVAATAGPIGRGAAAGTNLRFESGILSYSRSKGLFAGISLAGARIEPDPAANELYYGKGVTVQDVLYEDEGSLTQAGQELRESLNSARSHTPSPPSSSSGKGD